MAKLFGSQTSLREANRATILDHIHRFGAMTQIELAEATGLSTATISTLVRQLVDENRLTTQNTVRNGRRATLVTIVRQQGLAIGLHISRHDLRMCVVDAAEQILAEHNLPLARDHKTDTTINRAMTLINETLSNLGAETEELLGIGVAVSAPVDTRSHAIMLPGILPGWDGADIITPLSNTFHVPVIVDNDSNCAAMCESRMGVAQGEQDSVYVNAGGGVGAGIITKGKIWHGVTGLAGEIGHIQVDPLGSICSCGNRGCLDTVVGEDRLVSLLNVTHGNLTLTDLVSTARKGDPGCRKVVADAATRIGNVCADLCIAIDPQIVVIGGELSLSGDDFVEPFSQSLQRLLFPYVLEPIEVMQATHPVNGPALGAASLSLSEAEKVQNNR
jgi:predicted NBD/HSP70 family sugar kinase